MDNITNSARGDYLLLLLLLFSVNSNFQVPTRRGERGARAIVGAAVSTE